MDGPSRRRMALHCTGQAQAERPYRELQRSATRRIVERKVVLFVGTGALPLDAGGPTTTAHARILRWKTPSKFALRFNPRQLPSLLPLNRPNPMAWANSELNKTWGQRQQRPTHSILCGIVSHSVADCSACEATKSHSARWIRSR